MQSYEGIAETYDGGTQLLMWGWRRWNMLQPYSDAGGGVFGALLHDSPGGVDFPCRHQALSVRRSPDPMGAYRNIQQLPLQQLPVRR